MGKLEREKWSENGVIVTVYEELATVGSLDHQHGMIGVSNKTIRRERSSQPCRHYDRRADLLAYAHHLQDMASHHLHQDLCSDASIPSKPHLKFKKRRRSLRKLRLSFGGTCGGKKEAWRYENIESRGTERKYSRSCFPRSSKWSKLSKILRRFMKELSSAWKCNKNNQS